MNCFICNIFFNEWKPLLRHLTSYHFLERKDVFPCKYDSCEHIFSDLYEYGRHFKLHLTKAARIKSSANNPNTSDELFPIMSCTSSNVPFKLNANAICNKNISSSIADENSIEPSEIAASTQASCNDTLPQFESRVDSSCNLNDSIIFLLKMHAKNNFCRSDVAFVQQEIDSRVQSIVKSFKDFIDENCELDSMRRLRLATLVDQTVNESHCNTSTEYHIMNLLKEKGYLQDVMQFSVNNEISEVFRNGEIIYGESNSKASLLPISFQFKSFLSIMNDCLWL